MKNRFVKALSIAGAVAATATLAQNAGLKTDKSAAAAAGPASAALIDSSGKEIGKATLTQTAAGVLVFIEAKGLPPGEHALHFHAKGSCDVATKFESAGAHYEPRDHQHGFATSGGPHAGDMPNQFVGADGALKAHVLNPNVTLGQGTASLFDADGSALVVHAKADDYKSQPAGNAGDRIACGVVKR
jgi:superoxide dismutase, Cu-Zn family